MTDTLTLILDVEVGALAFSMVGTILIGFLYLFSSSLREVSAEAVYNFRRWVRGSWSVRTGKSTVPVKRAVPIPVKEFE